MNTLKFKALLNTNFLQVTLYTYGIALVAYAVITLPVIVIPSIYAYSLLLAAGFGLAAWAVYTLFIVSIYLLKPNKDLAALALVICIPLCVAFAYSLIEVFGVWDMVWQEKIFIWFPIAAVIAGWISIYKSWKRTEELIYPELQTNYL